MSDPTFEVKALALLARDGYSGENPEQRLGVLKAYIQNSADPSVIEEPFIQAIVNGNSEHARDVLEVATNLVQEEYPELFKDQTKFLK